MKLVMVSGYSKVRDARGTGRNVGRAPAVQGSVRHRFRPGRASWAIALPAVIYASIVWAGTPMPGLAPSPAPSPSPAPVPVLPLLHFPFVIHYSPGTGFRFLPAGQAQTPVDINFVALRAYDPSHNWLRIEASPGQAGTHTPNDANQVFSSIFDATNNAVHVSCISGCGGTFGTDISAIDATHQKVVGLDSIPLSLTAPANGQVYQYSSGQNQWVPVAMNPFSPGGDLSGSPSSQTVVGLQGKPLAASSPGNNQVLAWNGSAWAPTSLVTGSGTCTSNQFADGVAPGGGLTCAQPAFSGVSGTAAANQLPPASSSAQGAVQLAQDLAGSATAPEVAGLQGNPVSSATPTSNQVLTWNGTAWAPANAPAAGAQIAQDLGGTTTAPKVIGLQGNPVASTAPVANQFLGWNTTNNQWQPTQPGFTGLTGTVADSQLASSYSGTGACLANQFATTLTRDAGPTCAQPLFSNLGGSLALNQTPLSSNGDLLTVSSGTLSRLAIGSANQCLQVNGAGTGYQFGTCGTGGGGVPGGSNAQVQFNNSGSFGGATSFTYNTSNGAVSMAALTDAVTLALSPSTAAQASDVFQVYEPNATPSPQCATNLKCAFAVQYNGNLFFAGNSATYGAGGQATQSLLRLYGSATGGSNVAPPYFQFLSGNGTYQTNLFSSISQNGILCVGTSVPGGDCGQGQQLVLNPMTTGGDLIVGSSPVLGTAQPIRLGIGSVGQCLQVLTNTTLGYGTCGSGTVTSVGLSLPNLFTVSGSPVTSSGTLSATLATQSANQFFAGPSSGSAAAPTFRSLAPADAGMTTEGDLLYNYSGALARLGVGASGQCLTSNGTDPLWGSCGGSVASVGLSLPGIFSVSGSPVTSSGTLTGTLASQNANLVWAGPASGVAAAPTFRGLVKADQFPTTVYTDQANTWTAGAQDMSAAASYRVPVAAGLTATANGQIGYDSTANVPHMAVNSADAKLATFTATPVTGDCVQWIGATQIGDQGSPCGSSLSSLAAASTSDTLANGNNPQVWNWAQTTASQSGLTFGETSAATGTGDNEVKISTQSNSTAIPLNIAQGSITNSTSVPALNIIGTWNNSSLGGEGIQVAITNTSSGSSSTLINLLAGSSGLTSEFSVSPIGVVKSGGAFEATSSGVAFSASGFSTSITFEGGQNAANNAAAGGATFQGGDQTGSGGSSSAGGYALFRGGNNAATNASSYAGSVQIGPGQSTGTTQGLQGLYVQYLSYVKGATATQWNVECFSAAMTTADCGASPTNWIGIAEVVNTNTVQVIASGQTPVNAAPSPTPTVGDAFCTSSTAGKGIDNGSTLACTLGTQIGIVAAVSGTYKLPDGTTFTASSALPLIQIARD